MSQGNIYAKSRGCSIAFILSLLISMLQKSQIKKLHFIEHHNTCTMILISRKDYKLITRICFSDIYSSVNVS